MRTGILGGTFNPIHIAHLRIAEEVREACDLDRVIFLPAAIPPHKEVACQTSFAQRMEMAELATKANPFFSVSDLETRQSGKNYSVNTLRNLHLEHPGDEFYFIIGMDSFRDIGDWKNYRELFALTNIVVAARPGVTTEAPDTLLPVAIREEFCYALPSKKLLHETGSSVTFLEETFLDISSTQIRSLVSQGKSVKYLVPPEVEEYIHGQGLYR